jgi:FMN-dependent NADH-azoreductase
MTHVLQINSSLFSGHGQSTLLAERFVAGLQARAADTLRTVRDLAAEPVPHLDGARFQALISAPAARTPEQQAVVDYADQLVSELKAADVIVLGLPMYNFGVPSVLKAYFDHVARAGITFRYTAQGPEGLLKGKKVYVFATRGGRHAGTAQDTQTQYVRDFFAFIGLDQVQFVYAEGLAMGDEPKQAGLAEADRAIASLLTERSVAQAA